VVEVPDYSQVSEEYASSRPAYPPELFEWLAAAVPTRGTAWDTATGNGQAAWGLAAHFEHVIATDVSANQLRFARRHPRIEYRVAPAETSGLAATSVDLVVAAAAIHWFDLPRFYDEVLRVTHRGSVVAAWTYHVAHVAAPLDKVLWPFYRDVVAAHFAEGARLVDDRYAGIILPGEQLSVPSFRISVMWSAQDVLRFVRTWSGVQSYMAVTRRDPVKDLADPVEDALGGRDRVQELSWPVYLRAARL
jgi:hypothetical protein